MNLSATPFVPPSNTRLHANQFDGNEDEEDNFVQAAISHVFDDQNDEE